MPEQPHGQQHELISIDIARAIAALAVFYYHQHIGSLIATMTGIGWLGNTDVFGATYAVPLFFLVSGYCIHLSNLKYLRSGQRLPIVSYFKRRLLRIYPAYLFTLGLSLAVNRLTSSGDFKGLPDLLAHLFLLQGLSEPYFNTINVVLWTITIEAMLYILYPYFYFLCKKFSLTKALLFSLAVSMISITFFTLKPFADLPDMYCVFNIWFAWCCGAFLAQKWVMDKPDFRKSRYWIIYGILLIVFIVFKLPALARFGIINYQLNILVWSAPLLLLLSHESWFHHNRSHFLIRLLAGIGTSSYSLYLMHTPLIALKNYLVHLVLPASWQSAGMIAGIFAIPVLAGLGYRYIELPFMTKKHRHLLIND